MKGDACLIFLQLYRDNSYLLHEIQRGKGWRIIGKVEYVLNGVRLEGANVQSDLGYSYTNH